MERDDFRKLCTKWVRHVRAGDEYQAYRDVEMRIISNCDSFGLDSDEVFANLHSFANSGEPIEEVF